MLKNANDIALEAPPSWKFYVNSELPLYDVRVLTNSNMKQKQTVAGKVKINPVSSFDLWKGQMLCCSYCWACRCRLHRQWRKCAVASQSSSCPCTCSPPAGCKWGTSCKGSRPRRTTPSTSATWFWYISMHFDAKTIISNEHQVAVLSNWSLYGKLTPISLMIFGILLHILLETGRQCTNKRGHETVFFWVFSSQSSSIGAMI